MILGQVLDALYADCPKCGRRVLKLKLRRTMRDSPIAAPLVGFIWQVVGHHCPPPSAEGANGN